MKASELRIGNYNLFEGRLDQISDGYDIDHVKHDADGQHQPIPITEDWLIKLGFIIRDKKYSLNYGGESRRYALLEKYKGNNSFILYFHIRFGETLYNTEDGLRREDHAIKHVHELQNLFFALTNEELKLHEEKNN